MATENNNSIKSSTHPDREQLFGNEAFAIGMLQVVSGGSIVSAISQLVAIIELGGKVPFLVLISAMSLSLLSAVLAAYFRHQYKMWDVKQNITKATFYLASMRRFMLSSVIFVVIGMFFLIGSFWYAAYYS